MIKSGANTGQYFKICKQQPGERTSSAINYEKEALKPFCYQRDRAATKMGPFVVYERIFDMNFPNIQTNFWDAVIAVPLIIVLTEFFKLFPIPRKYFPTIATTFGFIISIFISHRGDITAGLFMGGFYGAAAIGGYSSMKTAWLAYKSKLHKKKRNK